jgi:3-dehydroquinate dehydratase
VTGLGEAAAGESATVREAGTRELTGTPERPLVVLLSGPNLQLFGQREPEIYGTETLGERVGRAARVATDAGWRLEHVQSDAEADLVRAVHGARGRASAIVVNAGALSHYGWSLHDALASFDGVVVELHVSNPSSRERWRSTSVVAPVADGVVSGFGGLGYELAVGGAIALATGRS